MSHYPKTPFAESTAANAVSRGLLSATVLAILALGLVASPASATTPAASTGAISEISYTSAKVSGEVGPTAPGADIVYFFQYSTDGTTWSNGPEAFSRSIPAESAATPVTELLTGLKGGTEYFVRLAVNDGAEETYSPEPYPTFTTLAVALPEALAVDVSETGYTKAQVTGEVKRPANPDPAFDVTCRFEYVTAAQFDDNQANSRPLFEGAGGADCEQNPVTKDSVDGEGKQAVSASLTGLAPGTTYHLRLNAANAGGSNSLEADDTFTTLVALPPSVLVDPVINPRFDSADVTSTVNPNGTPTSAYFEFSGDGGVTWKFAPFGYPFDLCCEGPAPVDLGEGTSPVAFNKTLREVDPYTQKIPPLEPNATYLVRLRAENLGGTTVSPTETFKTAKAPPSVQTLSVTPGSVTATLAGRINPRNALVKYQFEWGIQEGAGDDTYEHVTPVPAELVGSVDNAFHLATASITDLTPASSYHYRLVAIDAETGDRTEGQDRPFTTLPEPHTAPPCPNEASRVGPSAALPDCRAYELASVGLNNASLGKQPSGFALADGTAVGYRTIDAPDNAQGAAIANFVVSRRSQGTWNSESMAPPIVRPLDGFNSSGFLDASRDLTQAFVFSAQPLAGPDSPSGLNFYLRKADRTFVPMTEFGSPYSSQITSYSATCVAAECATSGDFSHVFYRPCVKQVATDPVEGCPGNTYDWGGGKPKLLGILPGPGEVPAPDGATPAGGGVLPVSSDDGTQVLFSAGGFPGLYLRSDGEQTTEVSLSQRDNDPDPVASAKAVGITADGSEVLFTSPAELTEDANTGSTEGVPNESGADLYSYDVDTGNLTDLTVDDKVADVATGANVQRVVGATADASYIYFVATGDLAAGAISGQLNLYVERDGVIDFIAPAAGLYLNGLLNSLVAVYVTPTGHHVAFISTESLTGYDNTDPNSGQAHAELYIYTYRGGLVCASCRPDGEAPIADAEIHGRALTDDGSRAFFQSADEILPQASNGLRNVFEYSSGQVHLLTPGDSQSKATLIDASASGDDVFIATHDELQPGQGVGDAVYDARVNADIPQPDSPNCQGEACRGKGTSPPIAPSGGSSSLESPPEFSVPVSKAAKGSRVKLRFLLPEGGKLQVSGNGLKPRVRQVQRAGSVTVTVSLRAGANRTRVNKGVYKTKAQVLFRSIAGRTSRGAVPLSFDGPAKKGGKR